jgi:hypothetical protein
VRKMVEDHPDMLQPLLEQMGKSNPAVLELLTARKKQFAKFLVAGELAGLAPVPLVSSKGGGGGAAAGGSSASASASASASDAWRRSSEVNSRLGYEQMVKQAPRQSSDASKRQQSIEAVMDKVSKYVTPPADRSQEGKGARVKAKRSQGKGQASSYRGARVAAAAVSSAKAKRSSSDGGTAHADDGGAAALLSSAFASLFDRQPMTTQPSQWWLSSPSFVLAKTLFTVVFFVGVAMLLKVAMAAAGITWPQQQRCSSSCLCAPFSCMSGWALKRCVFLRCFASALLEALLTVSASSCLTVGLSLSPGGGRAS